MAGLPSRPAASRRGGAARPTRLATTRVAPAPQPRRRPWLWGVGAVALSLSLAVGFVGWQRSAAPLPDQVAQVGSALEREAGTASAGIPELSLEQLLRARTQGDWLVHRLRGAPAILVVEFPDLQSQGLSLNRVAALFEKAGGRQHQVMSDAELSALLHANGDTVSTFYLGHDYQSEDLATFFSMAHAQGVTLNPQEMRLLRLLLDVGMLRDDGSGQYAAAAVGALVSFSSIQSAAVAADGTHIDQTRRGSILRHELSHGRYFTDSEYQRYCEFFWRELLTDAERKVWRRYLGDQGYNAANEDLMINEMQALLMHTTDERDFSAAALHWSDADLEGLRQRFRLGWSG